MRAPILALALLTVAAASRGGCNGDAAYEPCAGKACGEACRTCPPDDASCVEPALPPSMATVCDPRGACAPVDVLAAGWSGAAAAGCPSAACAGKACGEACAIDPPCRAATPPCMMPSQPGACDAAGACVPLGLPGSGCPPHPDCVGKTCGASCNPCGPERACPTFAATACDAALRCTTVGTFDCPPAYEPCAGKAAGACCTICPPDASGCSETAVLKACDAAGACVAAAGCAP